MARLAATETAVAFCPSTSLKLAKGATAIGSYPEMLQQGVTVGLGTDGVSAAGNLNLHRQMYLVAGLFKDARLDPTLIGARRALRMATIEGARALGWDDEIGSLEPGKKADLLLWDTQRPEWQALFNPVNNLVYNADGRSLHTVIIDGRVVVDAYRQSFVDEPRLYSKVQEIGERLLARTGISHPRSRWPIV